MTDPKLDHDDFLEFLSTFDEKILKQTYDNPGDWTKESWNVKVGILLAASGLIDAIKETIEEHGLPG